MRTSIFSFVITLVSVMTLGACKHHDHSHAEAGDGHHHHHAKLHLTAYDTDYELYAKACPMATGQTGSIELYVTRLDSFRPADGVEASVALHIGNKKIDAEHAHGHAHYVHHFKLTPDVAGQGEIMVTLTSASETRQVRLAQVTVYADAHEAEHAAEHDMPTSSNGVTFEKEKSWNAVFSTEVCRQEPAQGVIKTMAQILPAQGDEREVIAQSSGIIDFGGSQLVDGKAVNAGQSLLAIKGGNMADNNLTVKFREAESNYQLSQAEYARKTRLYEERIVAEREWLQAKRDMETAEAIYNNLCKNFNADKQHVSSPISGYVKDLAVRNGEYVEAGTRIATIAQNKHLYIKAELQAKHYAELAHVSGANLRTLNNARCYSLEELNGRLLSYGKAVETGHPLLPVLFEIKNTADFLPGTFVEMYILCQGNNTTLTVPNESIVEEMGHHFVYVQLTPEFFEKRSVELGITNGRRTVIRSGLKAGERVVAKGAVLVKLSQASGALDAHSGHVH